MPSFYRCLYNDTSARCEPFCEGVLFVVGSFAVTMEELYGPGRARKNRAIRYHDF